MTRNVPPVRWGVEISRTAEKQITKLDRPAQELVQRFLRERLRSLSDPRQLGTALRGDKRGLWRYRVGAYRLICGIQDRRVIILMLEVGHRTEIYR